MNEPELLTVRQAAEMADCTLSAVYHALGRNLMVAGFRPFKVRRSDVLRWIEFRLVSERGAARWESK